MGERRVPRVGAVAQDPVQPPEHRRVDDASRQAAAGAAQRRAQEGPLHPGGVPALPDDVTREAYSHEVSSAGFWPGGGGTDFPAFYSYAYPAPKDFGDTPPAPEAAYFDPKLGEFLLPYDAVRKSADPEAALMAFLESTYRAAADLGGWDRDALECPIGEPLRPRRVAAPSKSPQTIKK